MPVDYSTYPPNWFTEIRPMILERAGHKCETCGVANYATIYRYSVDGVALYLDGGVCYYAEKREVWPTTDKLYFDAIKYGKATKIILTIAHLCNNSLCDNPEHLKALCQRCHLRLDMGHHVKNRKANKARKSGQLNLLDQLKSAVMQMQVAPGTLVYDLPVNVVEKMEVEKLNIFIPKREDQ